MKTVFRKKEYFVSTDKRILQIKKIHSFLTRAYWSEGISIQKIKRAIKGSICFGVFHKTEQIGFARVVTDKASIAYIADLFIIENYRGKKLSVWLMKCILSHPELKDVKAFMLATKDAHGLYAKFGFEKLKDPDRFMRMQNPLYKK